MPTENIQYHQLEPGYEFPPSSYSLDKPTVAIFLKAVEENNDLYQATTLVPPMAVTARAMAALSANISFPPGTIHVSQELDFTDTVNYGETLDCRARVLRKQERGGLRLMVIGIDVFKKDQKRVLSGKTSFVLPP